MQGNSTTNGPVAVLLVPQGSAAAAGSNLPMLNPPLTSEGTRERPM
jgi:hypothetical protein